MAMDSETYWAKRAKEREAYWYQKCQDTIDKELAAYYMDSLGRIQTDIAALYGRFAKDNQLTATEARKLLKGNEYRQWRMSIDQYVKTIRETGDKTLERELNTLAMRSRISRLDKLYGETLMELQSLGEKVTTSMKAFLSEAYTDNYYHGVYDIAKAGQLRNAVSKVDTKALEDVLRYRWSGMNYSERIWKNQRFLAYNLRKEMIAAVHRGESIEKISSRIAKRMDTGISNARRLVRTELNYVNNHAALDSIDDSGMKYYRFTATLDSRTSAVCRAHDGHVYPLSEAVQGTNVPPLHPNCRSTISGSLRGEGSAKKGTRAARNGQGKTIFVPASMTYDDWKAVYVDKSQTLADWLKSDIIKIKEAIQKGTTKLKSTMSETEYNEYVDMVAKSKVIYPYYARYADNIEQVVRSANGGVYQPSYNTLEYSFRGKEYEGINKYSTLAHEYGHFFDAQVKFKGLRYTEVEAITKEITALKQILANKPSRSDTFLAAMRADKAYIKSIINQEIIEDLKKNHASAGVQDAIDGLFTNSRILWGHGEAYYNRRYNIIKKLRKTKELKQIYQNLGLDASSQAKVKALCRIYDAASEAWANIASAVTVGGQELEYIKKYLPNSYRQFIKIMEGNEHGEL